METVVLFHNEEGDLETEKDAYSITKAEFLPVSPATQTVIRPATVSGPDMRFLMTTLKNCLPLAVDALPASIKSFFNFRDELTLHTVKFKK